jgi:hypothetical protein
MDVTSPDKENQAQAPVTVNAAAAVHHGAAKKSRKTAS